MKKGQWIWLLSSSSGKDGSSQERALKGSSAQVGLKQQRAGSAETTGMAEEERRQERVES
jgi:hypothetical protein